MSTSNKSARLRGFTLIELLVVVAIIMVLAALLSPALQSALARGHDSTCRSNLKSHYTALLRYSLDRNGQFPGVFNPPSAGADCNSSTWVIWQTTLVKGGYLPGWTNAAGNRGFVARGLDCPANLNGYYPEPGSTPGNTTFKNGSPDYLYNAEMGYDASCAAAAGGARSLVDISMIDGVSRKGVMFEGGNPYGWPEYRSGYTITGWAGYFDPTLVTYSIADPHGNRSNVLFLDGHVESFVRGTIDWRIAALTNP
ncbi:MAG TPA: prepilin-type N-terminal cleavage/methylation domain-containing protein [Kiritimatiellia bacterium]|nr:prepilin-type N-terminal cleavage/methylation domain-containing protein [Kiritimatiellia bacterium]